MDYNTVFYMNVFANFIITLVMVIHWQAQKTYNGFGYWVLANVFIMLFSFIGLYNRTILHSILLANVQNAFLVESVVLRYIGICRFWNKTKLQKHNFIFMIIIILGYGYLSLIHKTGLYAIYFGGIIETYFYILMLHFFTKPRVDFNRVVIRLIIFTNLISCIVMIFRTTAMTINFSHGINSPTIYGVIYFIVQNLTDVILAMSFIMLNSQQLAYELETANEKLKEMVYRDSLTGVLNRTGFKNAFDKIINITDASKQLISIFMIDIDMFKNINDTYGHVDGDKVLQHLANILVKELRCQDAIGRFGGEEFSVILPGISKYEAFKVAETIRNKIEDSIVLAQDCKHIKYSISIGVNDNYNSKGNLDKLLHEADMALYEAKNKSRNCTVVYSI